MIGHGHYLFHHLRGSNMAWFLSYSRQQLYFAESLVAGLQAAGIQVWFDLDQLQPGTDWTSAIAESLADCDGIVLVASRQSLASEYVESEWKTVLQAGKPVCVVFYEAAILPDALANAPRLDMRVGFDRQLARLVAFLRNGTALPTRPLHVNRLNLPTRFALSLWAVIGILVLAAVIWFGVAALFALYFFPQASVSSLVGFYTGIAIANIVSAWDLLHHRASVGRLSLLLVIAMPGMIVLILFGVLEFTAYLTGPQTFCLVLFNVVIWSALLLIHTRSIRAKVLADILRWMPVGMAPQWLRVQVNKRRVTEASGLSTLPGVRYSLYNVPLDEAIAEKVRAAMGQFGHLLVTDDATADVD